jgi:hypothetical protein
MRNLFFFKNAKKVIIKGKKSKKSSKKRRKRRKSRNNLHPEILGII